MKLTVNLGKNSYPIYIENNILDKASSYISSCFSGKKIMIISDDNVFPLYGEKLKTSLGDYEVHELVLPHGEPTKAFETLPALYNALLKQKFSLLNNWMRQNPRDLRSHLRPEQSPDHCGKTSALAVHCKARGVSQRLW